MAFPNKENTFLLTNKFSEFLTLPEHRAAQRHHASNTKNLARRPSTLLTLTERRIHDGKEPKEAPKQVSAPNFHPVMNVLTR